MDKSYKIPRSNLKVSTKTFICEKHFTAGQIIRTWESGTGANKIVVCINNILVVASINNNMQ